MIEYKGYTGVFEFDPDLVLFAGHVVDLRDQIYFEGSSVSDLQESMKVAVDHYLDVCEQRDEAPGRPFSGLHRRIVANRSLDRIANAMERGVTLLEDIHAAIQPVEEADEVLDTSAGLVMVRATTKDGTARCYVVRTESTRAAIEAACTAWECKWADLVEKSVET